VATSAFLHDFGGFKNFPRGGPEGGEAPHGTGDDADVFSVEGPFGGHAGPIHEPLTAGVFEREDPFPQGPVAEFFGDFVCFVGEYGHFMLEQAIVGEVTKGDVAAKDAPPAVAFEPVASGEVFGINKVVEGVFDFLEGIFRSAEAEGDFGFEDAALTGVGDAGVGIFFEFFRHIEVEPLSTEEVFSGDLGVGFGFIDFAGEHASMAVTPKVVGEGAGGEVEAVGGWLGLILGDEVLGHGVGLIEMPEEIVGVGEIDLEDAAAIDGEAADAKAALRTFTGLLVAALTFPTVGFSSAGDCFFVAGLGESGGLLGEFDGFPILAVTMGFEGGFLDGVEIAFLFFGVLFIAGRGIIPDVGGDIFDGPVEDAGEVHDKIEFGYAAIGDKTRGVAFELGGDFSETPALVVLGEIDDLHETVSAIRFVLFHFYHGEQPSFVKVHPRLRFPASLFHEDPLEPGWEHARGIRATGFKIFKAGEGFLGNSCNWFQAKRLHRDFRPLSPLNHGYSIHPYEARTEVLRFAYTPAFCQW